jgi:hypothetical protein
MDGTMVTYPDWLSQTKMVVEYVVGRRDFKSCLEDGFGIGYWDERWLLVNLSVNSTVRSHGPY